MNTKRLTLLAMLIAMYLVLSYPLISTETFKFTLEAFPILVASLLLGPIDGLIVGGVGSFIYQVYYSGYGLTATTIIWILPHMISGLLVGLYAKLNKFNLNQSKIILISIFSAILVTTLNTFAMYIDALIYQYPFKVVIPTIIIRILVGIVLAIIYSLVLPKLLKLLNKFIK